MSTKILVVLLMVLPWPSLAQENPVTNGGFEDLSPGGVPVDWQVLGTGRVVDDAHSGDRAILLERTPGTRGETGLNRAWVPHSGQQGAMLSQLKGGVRFWYKAERASQSGSLVFFVITMSGDPIENTGSPRAAYVIPDSHVGDGQWHEGVLKYDFTDNPKVKWVHLSPRISGEWARLLLDDISWVERVGPLPKVQKLELREVEGREGEECFAHARVANDGDETLALGTAKIVLPEGLRAHGGPSQNVQSLEPDAAATLTWRVLGRRQDRGRMSVRFTAGELEATGSLDYAPRLELLGLLAQPSVMCLGETSRVVLKLRNTGHAMVRQVVADLRASRPLAIERTNRRQELALIRPGACAELAWDVRANTESPGAALRVVATASNTQGGRASSVIVVGGALPRAGGSSTTGAAVALEAGGCARIQNQRVRIVFPRSSFGLGVGVVQRRTDHGWQTVGRFPRLTRLVVAGPGGKPEEHLVYAAQAREVPSPEAAAPHILPATLELAGACTDGNGVRWTVAETVTLRPGDCSFKLRVSAVPDGPASLLALDGPTFIAGDGAPAGTRRLDAIFPGLEWLVEGEESSSALDIAPDHPDRLRYVPHPHMVTLPLMTVRLAPPEGAPVVCALLWDHLWPYLGKHNRPCPVFASPDRFEGRAGTTMGLLAPSMPEYIYPNQRTAHTGLAVRAGETVELSGHLLVHDAGPGDTALAALKAWFERYGIPDPNPKPHGQTWQDEIAFSMAAYLDSLWIPEQEKWWPSLGGPALFMKEGWPPPYLYDLRMCMELCPDHQVVAKVKERYDRVVKLSGLQPESEDLGFQFAGPAERVAGRALAALGLIRQQEPDGSWRFRARVETSGIFKGMDYAELGPDRAAEVGTCARSAWEVLRVARITGSPEATEAGLRALDFMDRFEVPRAAQVWEVPVHTPDILAAADACQAYLEGYRITGLRRYLDKAVYWARAGLPFLYFWDTEGYEFLKYASIPVFGATWYQGSWFGRPVQWNGLRYAYALLELAEYDQSFDWAKVAEGITISAMYQQSTDEKDRALWPDSIGAIDRIKSGWVFGPQLILTNVYALMGLQPTPMSARTPSGFGHIIVTAAGRVSSPQLDAGRLSCTVAFTPPQTGYAVVTNISRPVAVYVNAVRIPEAATSKETPAPSWRYLPAYAMLELRLSGSGQHNITVEGVGYQPSEFIPKMARSLSFGFDADPEGWAPTNHLDQFRGSGGILQAVTTGPDPYTVRENCDVPADTVKVVRIRMALAAGLPTAAQLYFTTKDSPQWAEDKCLRFEVVSDGQFHEYVIPVAEHPLWKGTVTAIRLDPTNGTPYGQVQVDYIRGEASDQ